MISGVIRAFAIAFAILLTAVGAARAQPARCYEAGDIVTFDGVAAREGSRYGGGWPAWVLNLSQPICVVNADLHHAETSAIRIIGTPPPLGVPLALTGKLLLGPSASGPVVFAALEVIRGRKIGSFPSPKTEATQGRNMAPSPKITETEPAPPPPTPNNVQCDSPPYGGTQSEFHRFVQKFNRVVIPAKILAGVCNAKFGRASRAGLHKLGLTDAQIDTESTERLAADTIVALKKLVNGLE
jgi:hypothetical protein